MPVLPGLQQRPLTSTLDGAETNFGGKGGHTMSQHTEMQMLSHRDPFFNRLNRGDPTAVPNRPSSTVLMQVGDKDVKKLIKKKFDLVNAR